MVTLKEVAERVATGLMRDLKGGKITKLGIHEIRIALSKDPGWCDDNADELEEMTTRLVVQAAFGGF